MKVESFAALEEFANDLSKNLTPKTLILLEGPLGAGKTQLTSFILKALNEKTEVSSPTFSIYNQYKLSKFDVYHVDLYRISNQADLESTGFWDLFDDDNCIIIIEWSDLLNSSYLPKNWEKIKIKIKYDGSNRELSVN